MASPAAPTIIGVAGTNGAGKDTVGEALKAHGFYVLAAREVIGEFARKTYDVSAAEAKERDVLNKAGNELRRTLGPAAIIHSAVDHYDEQPGTFTGLAVTSIRAIAEAEAITALGGWIIYVDAPAHTRWQRMQERHRDTESALSFEAFIQKEQLELKGLSAGDPKAIQHIEAVGELADLRLYNDKDGIEEFETEAYARLQEAIPALHSE